MVRPAGAVKRGLLDGAECRLPWGWHQCDL